jgi:hypothetical protein
MQTDRATELTLSLEPGATTVAGTVADPAGRSLRFEGWLGLAATLEAFLRGQSAGQDEEESRPPG